MKSETLTKFSTVLVIVHVMENSMDTLQTRVAQSELCRHMHSLCSASVGLHLTVSIPRLCDIILSLENESRG